MLRAKPSGRILFSLLVELGPEAPETAGLFAAHHAKPSGFILVSSGWQHC